MKVWQAAGCGIVSLIAFVGLIVGVVFWATGDITKSADDFFAAANDGDFEEAYNLTSQQLQGQVDQAGLQIFLTDNSLDQVVETSWSSRSIQNDKGTLTGTVTTRSGGAIPIEIDLVSEGDEWKIVFIDVDNTGLQSGGGASANAAPMEIPSAQDQKDLINAATSHFYRSLGDPDFSSFHGRWAQGITVEQLEESFGGFRPFQSDMAEIVVSDPEFDPATTLDQDGNLALSGVYKLDAGQFQFNYVFTREGGATKIAQMDAGWD